MGSIINGFNPALPSQNRVRVRLTHNPTTCEVYFDFDAGPIYYTTDGSQPTVGGSPSVSARGTAIVPYLKQVKALTPDGSEYTAWTPPPIAVQFGFEVLSERPPCSNSDIDIRVFNDYVFVYTDKINASKAFAIVRVKDTNTICEDVGIFYAFDGADPDPCPNDAVCVEPGHDLLNTLVNYEVLTTAIGRKLWLTAKAVTTQVGSGAGCIENFCTESINGSSWL